VVAYAPPLERDLCIWGPLSLTLYAASSQIDTAWYVKVMDVKPDGTAAVVSKGNLRASFRALDGALSAPGQPFHPFEQQELIEPNRIYEFQIELVPMFHTFGADHRLQVQIASEDLQYNNPMRQIDVQLLPWPWKYRHHDAARHHICCRRWYLMRRLQGWRRPFPISTGRRPRVLDGKHRAGRFAMNRGSGRGCGYPAPGYPAPASWRDDLNMIAVHVDERGGENLTASAPIRRLRIRQRHKVLGLDNVIRQARPAEVQCTLDAIGSREDGYLRPGFIVSWPTSQYLHSRGGCKQPAADK
jgi:hypothetical protein